MRRLQSLSSDFDPGSWKKKSGQELEEERRLYYVAMSRARETLQLFAIDHSQNPHVPLLAGDFLITRALTPSHKMPEQIPCYELLGMKELFIDFAGTKKENHPTSKALKELTTGSRLTIGKDKNCLHLLNHDGVPVARLAKSAQARWQERTEAIREIKVIALAKRYWSDIKDQEFQEKCHSESWEVPIVELRFMREECVVF